MLRASGHHEKVQPARYLTSINFPVTLSHSFYVSNLRVSFLPSKVSNRVFRTVLFCFMIGDAMLLPASFPFGRHCRGGRKLLSPCRVSHLLFLDTSPHTASQPIPRFSPGKASPDLPDKVHGNHAWILEAYLGLRVHGTRPPCLRWIRPVMVLGRLWLSSAPGPMGSSIL